MIPFTKCRRGALKAHKFEGTLKAAPTRIDPGLAV